MTDSPNNSVCIGVITSAHALYGRVKIKTFTEEPQNIESFENIFDAQGGKYVLSDFSFKKDTALASIKDVSTREMAEELVKTELFISKNELPEISNDEFYYDDLVGLRAKDESGRDVGIVEAVYNFGAGDIVEIKLKSSGKLEMLNFDKNTIIKVNQEAGILLIKVPDYLIADENHDV